MVLLAALAVSCIVLWQSVHSVNGQGDCRMDPASTHAGCGLPLNLSNFQGTCSRCTFSSRGSDLSCSTIHIVAVR